VAIQTSCVLGPGPRGLPSIYNLFDVQFIDRDIGFFTANGEGWHFSVGLSFKTEDGGITWTRIWDESHTNIKSIHFVNESKGFIISSGLLESSDGGVSWTKHSYLESDAIFFLNDSTGWTAYKHSIFRTINGGDNWNVEYSIPDDCDDFYSLYFYINFCFLN